MNLQSVPDDCKSSWADPNRASELGLGFVRAVTEYLTGEARVGCKDGSLSVTYYSSAAGGADTTLTLKPGTGKRLWVGESGATAPGVAPKAVRAKGRGRWPPFEKTRSGYT